MIAKLSTGNGFGGATNYLLRNGKSDEERAKVKVLAASGVDFTINKNGNIVLDARQVARDFRFQSMMMPSVRKPVYDIALSWKIGEHIPSDEKLARTKEFMKMIGFDNTQFIIVEHEKENEHSHAIANIVDNDGNRISTKYLIDRMHAAAREITKKYGYQWGDAAKKETIEKAHKPHEKVRYIIEPIVKEAVAKAKNIDDLPGLLEPSGIGCRIKHSSAGDAKGISFSYEMDGLLHTFRGGDLNRSLSAGNIVKSIGDRMAYHQEVVAKGKDIIAGYNSIFPILREEVSMVTVRNNAFQLMKAVDEAKITVSTETKAKFGELIRTWKEFNSLNQERLSVKSYSEATKSIGGMFMLLNPIIGLTVVFLAKMSNDIRQAEIKEQKKQLLARVESIRSEIDQLQQHKAQLKIEKQERLQEYLDAKRMLTEYSEGLQTVDTNIDAIKAEILKNERIDKILKFTQSANAQILLDNINGAFGTFEAHQHLVPGPLKQTLTGMRWELYTDGYTYGKEVDNPHAPAPVEYGKSYVDFSFNEKGQLIATIEADKTNNYTKGVSGYYNLDTGEGDVRERSYRGSKEEHDQKKKSTSQVSQNVEKITKKTKGPSL